MSAQVPSGITAAWSAALLLIAQPQTVHSPSGVSGVGNTAPRKVPNCKALHSEAFPPQLQNHPLGTRTGVHLYRGGEPQTLCQGIASPQHVQPENSELGHATWLLLCRGSTEKPSQHCTGKWDSGTTLSIFIQHFEQLVLFFSFCHAHECVSAVYRQQDARQRAQEARRQTSRGERRDGTTHPKFLTMKKTSLPAALHTSTQVLLLLEHCLIFTLLYGSHKRFPDQWGIPASITLCLDFVEAP